MYAYLSDICTDLAHCSEKVQACHPLLVAQAGFSSKVMEMLYNAIEYVL